MYRLVYGSAAVEAGELPVVNFVASSSAAGFMFTNNTPYELRFASPELAVTVPASYALTGPCTGGQAWSVTPGLKTAGINVVGTPEAFYNDSTVSVALGLIPVHTALVSAIQATVSGSVDVGNISGPVTLAAGQSVDVGTISGAVTVSGSVGITSGRVDVGTISGPVSLDTGQIVQIENTSGGSVTVAGTLSIDSGRVDVGTISGPVSLATGQIVQVENTSSGSVTVAGQVDVSQAAGDVLSISGDVTANVTAGTVTVSSGQVDVGTISGPVSLATGQIVQIENTSGGSVTVAGTVDVSQAAGDVLSISGDVTANVTAGTVTIESGSVSASVVNEQVGIGANYQSPVVVVQVSSGQGASSTETLLSTGQTVTMNEFILLCQSSAGASYNQAVLTFYLASPMSGGGSSVNPYYAVGSATIGTFNYQNAYQFTAIVTPTNGLWGEAEIPIVFDSFSVELTANSGTQTDTVQVALQTNGLAVAEPTGLDEPGYTTPTFALPGQAGNNDMTNGVPLPVQAYTYRPDASEYMNAGSYSWNEIFNSLPTSDYENIDIPATAGRNLIVSVYNGTNEVINVTPLYDGSKWQYPVANGGQSNNYYANPGPGRSVVFILPNAPAMQLQLNWSTAPSTGALYVSICGVDGG